MASNRNVDYGDAMTGGTYNSDYGYNTVPSNTAAPFQPEQTVYRVPGKPTISSGGWTPPPVSGHGTNVGLLGVASSAYDAYNQTMAAAQAAAANKQASSGAWGGLAFTPTWNNNAGYNPMHYLSDQSTLDLAAQLGGNPVQIRTTAGPFGLPPENMLDMGTGNLYNAGLMANNFRPDNAPFAQGIMQAEIARDAMGGYNRPGAGARPQVSVPYNTYSNPSVSPWSISAPDPTAVAAIEGANGTPGYVRNVLGGGSPVTTPTQGTTVTPAVNTTATPQAQSGVTSMLSQLLSSGAIGGQLGQVLSLLGLLGMGQQQSQLPPSNYWYSRPRYSIIG